MAAQIFVIMKTEFAVHFDGVGDTGADKIVSIGAATTQGEGSVGTIDAADEGGVLAVRLISISYFLAGPARSHH